MKITTLFLAVFLLSGSTVKNAALRPNRDYALFFAVNDYAPNSGFDDLAKPIENAEAVAKELRERYGFQTEVVKNPTLDQISAKLREYQAFYAKNPQGKYPGAGQLLIYFTGHGTAEDNNGYFVPADGDSKKLYSTAFAYEIWRPFINKIDCRHILMAIDACYSVTFDPDWYNKKMDPGDFKRPGELSEGDKLLLVNETDKCRIAFTSDGSEDKVPERSNFARKFLEGLRNGPRQDGILTSEALAGYLRFASPKPRLSEFGNDEKGSFLFVQVPSASTTEDDTKKIAATTDLEKDLQAWKAAKNTNTVAAYRDYLTRFPAGEFREQADSGIRAIEQDLALRRDDLAWQVAVEKNTADGYKKYQEDYPAGRHFGEAAAKMKVKALSAAKSTDSIEIDGLIFVKGGTFEMGCNRDQIEGCDENETPTHQVLLSDFYIGKYEVTQNQWRKVMGSDPPKLAFRECDHCPVEHISWNDALEFIKKLNEQTKNNYRLPTEAEWEYAARGGNISKGYIYSGSNNADEIGWYKSNSNQRTHPVGSKKPNELGLFDMSGNVWEWCSDLYNKYSSWNQEDPIGPATGTSHIFRGGSWLGGYEYTRITCRNYDTPNNREYNVGFRLARSN